MALQSCLVHLGGNALASIAIHEEVVRLKATGKPVVASMGNMAASAGYEISGQPLSLLAPLLPVLYHYCCYYVITIVTVIIYD